MRKTIEIPVRYVVQYKALRSHVYWTDQSVHLEAYEAIKKAQELFKDFDVRVVAEEVKMVHSVVWPTGFRGEDVKGL